MTPPGPRRNPAAGRRLRRPVRAGTSCAEGHLSATHRGPFLHVLRHRARPGTMWPPPATRRSTALFTDKMRAWHLADRDAPAWEPSGDEFFGHPDDRRLPAAPPAEAWSSRPGSAPTCSRAAERQPSTLFTPATVSDRSTARSPTLDGLNFSRAWCWRELAATLPGRRPLWPRSPRPPPRPTWPPACRTWPATTWASIGSRPSPSWRSRPAKLLDRLHFLHISDYISVTVESCAF